MNLITCSMNGVGWSVSVGKAVKPMKVQSKGTLTPQVI